MFTAIAIVFWVLVAVLLLLVLIMALPLRIEMHLSREEALRYSVALRPFGRFGPRIPLSDRRKKASKAAPKLKSGKRKNGGRWMKKPKRLVGAAVRLVMELVGCVRVEAATLDLRFGLGDPAETGQAYGQMAPLIYGTAPAPRLHINVEPVFDRAELSGRVALDVSLVPLMLVPPFVRFGWSAFGPGR